MSNEKSSIVVDGVEYVKKSSVTNKKVSGKLFVVRTYSAGVFFGEIKKRVAQEVTMTNVRRLWSWKGANELFQLASEGVKNPNDCKFSVIIPEVLLVNAIEIIPCTNEAIKIIQGVKEWKE